MPLPGRSQIHRNDLAYANEVRDSLGCSYRVGLRLCCCLTGGGRSCLRDCERSLPQHIVLLPKLHIWEMFSI